MEINYYLKFWAKVITKRKSFVTDRVESIYKIDFKKLKEQGYELIIFDFDDTLTTYHGNISEGTNELLQQLIDLKFKVSVHSNFSLFREEILSNEFKHLPGIFVQKTRNKPNPEGYLGIFKHFKVDPSKSVMIGDRIGTDIFGAYLSGIPRRILVNSYSNIFGGQKTDLPSRILRKLENIICL